MGTPLENARKKLATLREEIAGVERFIEMYTIFSDEGVAKTSERGHSEETYPQPPKPVNNSVKELRSGPTPRELADMTERLIRDVGRPMTRGEIVDALLMRDVEIPAQDKKRYVGTIVWRNKSRFQNIEGLGYWLRGEPLNMKETETGSYSGFQTDAENELPDENFDSDLFG